MVPVPPRALRIMLWRGTHCTHTHRYWRAAAHTLWVHRHGARGLLVPLAGYRRTGGMVTMRRCGIQDDVRAPRPSWRHAPAHDCVLAKVGCAQCGLVCGFVIADTRVGARGRPQHTTLYGRVVVKCELGCAYGGVSHMQRGHNYCPRRNVVLQGHTKTRMDGMARSESRTPHRATTYKGIHVAAPSKTHGVALCRCNSF